MGLTTFAGLPKAIDPLGMQVPCVTSAPAPMMQLSPTTAPSKMMEPMPTSELFPTVQP